MSVKVQTTVDEEPMTSTSAPVSLSTPLSDDAARALRVGQRILLSGVVYTARDTAHQRRAHSHRNRSAFLR